MTLTNEQMQRYIELIVRRKWTYTQAIATVRREFELPKGHSRKTVSLRLNALKKEGLLEKYSGSAISEEALNFEEKMLKVFEQAAKARELEKENSLLKQKLLVAEEALSARRKLEQRLQQITKDSDYDK
ncbi:MAG: hypothetical protein ACRKGH_02010 [Dehalogenimonas sp.]